MVLFPVISAVEFNLKEELSQGETLTARVSGNFLDPILKENIHFYRGHSPTSLSFEVLKIENDYYIYSSLLGKNPGNYSIAIEGARYFQGNNIINEDITKNFTITNETADFSVNPGVVSTDKDFYIEVQNLKNSEITISINTITSNNTGSGFFDILFGSSNNEVNSIVLKSGEIKKINFNINELNLTKNSLNTIELSSQSGFKYEIPVYVFSTSDSFNEETTKEKSFRFEKSKISINTSTESNTTEIIYLENTGKSDIEDISLFVSKSLEPYVFLSTNNISKIKQDSNSKIEIYILPSKEKKSIQGQITARAPLNPEIENGENIYAYSAVFLNFIENYKPFDKEKNETSNKSSSKETCSNLGGEICNSEIGEECGGDFSYATDGVCCLSECIKPKKSSTGKIIGWTIIFIIIIFVVWFFKFKFRRTKREANLFKIARRRR